MELQEKCEAVLPRGTLTGKFQPFKVEQLLSKISKKKQKHQWVIQLYITSSSASLTWALHSTSIRKLTDSWFFGTCSHQSQPVHCDDSSLFAEKACQICCTVHLITSSIRIFLTFVLFTSHHFGGWWYLEICELSCSYVHPQQNQPKEQFQRCSRGLNNN